MDVRSSEQLLSFLVLWLLCASAAGCKDAERQALLQFKRGLVDDYGILSSWGDGQEKRDCCRWRGVRCNNQTGSVAMLLLPAPPIDDYDNYMSLSGEISPSLLKLEHLTHLDLSHNDFLEKQIPPFLGSLRKMQYLNLSHTNLGGTIPTQLGNLSDLLSLDLSDNYWRLQSGDLEWLSHLSSLRFLDLSMVSLDGATHWPNIINQLASLVHVNLFSCGLEFSSKSLVHPDSSRPPVVFLDLSGNNAINSSIFPWLLSFSTTLVHLNLANNNLNSSIPDAFGNMTSLTYLKLWSCALEGEIPSAFGKMGALEHLDISGNKLHGEIPDTFGNMTFLTHLDLSTNQLEGRIPDAIGDLASLTHLGLSGNQLTALPRALGVSLVHVDISSNQLKGSILNTFDKAVSLEELSLAYNQLEGEIPESLGRRLVFLDLSSNQLQGSIPDTVGSMVSIERLSLSMNRLQGEIPKSFRNLCNLIELKLTSNNLSGQLPPDFLACANRTLQTFSLSDNWFKGSVPHFTEFSSLERLYLDYNQLNGTLPESIGQLGRLSLFDVGSNSLQGTISEAHFHNLSSLYHLGLSYNSRITFNLSSQWVPPFQRLGYLLLASCKLGPAFPGWLQTQKQLEELDLSNSDISDDVPDWFWNLTSRIRAFNLSNNQLRGVFPDLSSEFGLYPDIDISSNLFEGSVPRLPSTLTRLDLSHNKLSGSISSLCEEANSYMVYLDLSNNSLMGTLPNCWPQWENLTVLNLENNKFSGSIPSSLGSLQWIQTLHLRNNNLSGEIPISLKNCSRLRLIDMGNNGLSGEIPPWIGESSQNLVILSLRSNRLSGSIDSQLCQLKKLQILDLSSNDISGVIPRCFGNLTSMTKRGSLIVAHNYSFGSYAYKRPPDFKNESYIDEALIKWKGSDYKYKNILGLVRSIDLSSNNLIGEIPKEITNLIELVSLDLSRNNLSGPIPITIAQLKSLEVLDLSQNDLSGQIPPGLSELSYLSFLDLSNNNLSGKIPRGTQLQSFNDYSYKGNSALCGLPLLKKCPEDQVKQDDSSSGHGIEDEVQGDGNDKWLYISIALGFIVGFWGVCGTLILNKSLRDAYFSFLKKTKDWFLKSG